LPIYEYRCAKCSFQFEVRRSFGKNSSAPCPRCHGEGHLVFSPVPVIFKGPGFYTTDNREREKNSSKEGKAKEESKEGE
jgi:putative FmdB family regulatory protein